METQDFQVPSNTGSRQHPTSCGEDACLLGNPRVGSNKLSTMCLRAFGTYLGQVSKGQNPEN